ncbi:MAG: DUF4214 domain-containing protein [Pseudomonadota bacterium]
MITEVERIEGLIKRRILGNALLRDERVQLGGKHFRPMQLTKRDNAIARDYQRQTWTLAELLTEYDSRFVQNAYLVLLKRDADADGLNSRLNMLHTGECSRIELLFRLRYGAEGKEHGTAVKGLIRAFLFERICRIPVLGVAPRLLRALLHLPNLQRDLEELRGYVAMQANHLENNDREIVDFQNDQISNLLRRSKP